MKTGYRKPEAGDRSYNAVRQRHCEERSNPESELKIENEY